MLIKRLYYINQFLFLMLLSTGAIFAQEKFLFKSTEKTSIQLHQADSFISSLPGFNAPMFSRLDVDNDGVKDIYVYDKHNKSSLVYILNPDGTYSHRDDFSTIFPEISDWVLLVDYDDDGKEDLWTRDNYYNSVKLYRNVTPADANHVRFELVTNALRAYTFSELIDTTNLFCDKSNVPGIADIDGDGDIDFVTLQNTGLGVTLFLNNTAENSLPLHPPSFEMPDDCWGDFSEASLTNDIFLERYKFCRNKYYRYKKHAGGSSILLFDADGDSDKDVLLGNAGYDELAYLENGRNDFVMKRDSIIAFNFNYPPSQPAKAKVFAAAFLIQPAKKGEPARLMIAPTETDDANYSLDQDGSYPVYKNIASDGTFNFIPDTTFHLPGMVKDFGAYSHPAFGDLNGDGLVDLLIAHNGNAASTKGKTDKITYFKGIAPNQFKWMDDDFISLSLDSIEGLAPCIGDLNNDDKPDLIIGDKSGKIRCFQNQSSGVALSFTEVNWTNGITFPNTYAKPHICDIDLDSIPDLLIGTREGNILAYRNLSNTSPDFSPISDTFGNIAINPLELRSVQDPISNEWKDSLVPDIEGFISLSSIRDNQQILHLLLTRKDGHLHAFVPEDSKQPFGKYKISGDEISQISGSLQTYSTGYRSTVSAFKNPSDGKVWFATGNAGGGLTFFLGESVSGLKPMHETRFSIYPNPSYQFIQIESDHPFDGFKILDLSGRPINDHEGMMGDIKYLPAGIYLIQILNKKEVIGHSKFIKL